METLIALVWQLCREIKFINIYNIVFPKEFIDRIALLVMRLLTQAFSSE
jgi:hypothetical protein